MLRFVLFYAFVESTSNTKYALLPSLRRSLFSEGHLRRVAGESKFM
jgi:hypothetical protein